MKSRIIDFFFIGIGEPTTFSANLGRSWSVAGIGFFRSLRSVASDVGFINSSAALFWFSMMDLRCDC